MNNEPRALKCTGFLLTFFFLLNLGIYSSVWIRPGRGI